MGVGEEESIKKWSEGQHVTYISRLSDFALYVEDCLMQKHDTWEKWVKWTWCLTSK